MYTFSIPSDNFRSYFVPTDISKQVATVTVATDRIAAASAQIPRTVRRSSQQGTKVCRYNWHSAGSLGWPFPTLKYKYIFQIKYTEAIFLSNSTRKLLWFEIGKMLIAVLQNKLIVRFIEKIFGAHSFAITHRARVLQRLQFAITLYTRSIQRHLLRTALLCAYYCTSVPS